MGAVFLTALLAGAPRRRQIAVLAMLFLYPVYQFIAFSFDLRFLPRRDVRWGPFVVSVQDLERASLQVLPVYSFPANPVSWPTDRVVDLVARHAGDIQERPIRWQVNIAQSYFSPPVLWHAARRHGMEATIYSGLSPAHFLVMRSENGRYDPPGIAPSFLHRLLNDRRLPFVELERIPLPDQSEAVVYRRRSDAFLPNRAEESLTERMEAYGEAYYTGAVEDWRIRSDARSVVVPEPGAEIQFPYLYIPEGGASLQFGMGFDPAVSAAGCVTNYEVKATVLTKPVVEHLLRSQTLASSADPRWFDEAIPLDRFQGQIIHITLTARVDSAPDPLCPRLGWSSLKMLYPTFH